MRVSCVNGVNKPGNILQASKEETIRKRVARRAQQTGRSIPEATLKASIAAVERWEVVKKEDIP